MTRAVRDPSYRFLCAGFFVCGFHVAFIATHLPGVVAACQLPPAVGAWALGIVGLFNIVGSFSMGWAMGRWRYKSLLSLVYAARGVVVLAFLLAPKTETTVLVFAAAIGLTYLATVPPTAGLVAKFFGPAHMATLFGVVMLSHQIGGFFGAYFGGKAFEWTGSYDWMWYVDIVLAVGAALVHLPIREARPAAAGRRGRRCLIPPAHSVASRGLDARLDLGAIGVAPALDDALVLVEPFLGKAVRRMPGRDPRFDGEVSRGATAPGDPGSRPRGPCVRRRGTRS